jgi:hypothetical protein
MNKYFAMLMTAALLLTACGEAEETNKTVASVEEVTKEDGIANSSLMHNPVTADEVVSPETAAKIEFVEEVFDFGEITEGEVVEHIFKFKNTGENPLIINNAKGSCGCTAPEWPRSPIEPGGEGEMKVKFNSKGKNGKQDKTVTITANTLPNTTVIRVVGAVIPDPNKEAEAAAETE